MEKIRQFTRDRFRKVAYESDGSMPVEPSSSTVLVHLMPFSAFESRDSIPIGPELLRKHAEDLRTFGSQSVSTPFFNADGLCWSASDQTSTAYTQLFRTGVVEGANNTFRHMIGENEYINTFMIEQEIVAWFTRSLFVFQALEFQPSFEIALSISNTRVLRLPDPYNVRAFSAPIARQFLELPNVTLQDLTGLVGATRADNSAQKAIATRLKPMFDALWQSGGYAESPNYQPDGTWTRS